MKIGVACITYLRPKKLAQMLYCFEQQTHADRELVILDDAGQYADCEGDRWRLVSRDKRWPTLGEKRNAATALLGSDCDAVAVWDDDDLYLPWALEATARALENAAWSVPSLVLHPTPVDPIMLRSRSLQITPIKHVLFQHETGGLFHGQWAYRREAFDRVGGYPAHDNGEDQKLAARFHRAGIKMADPCRMGCRPFYLFPWEYNWCHGEPSHISGAGPNGYNERGALKADTPNRFALTSDVPPIDIHHPVFVDGVYPRKF